MQELTVAVLAGLGGMLGWGFADFFGKKAIDEIGDVVSLVWAHICGTAVFFLFAFYEFFATGHGVTVPQSGEVWAGLFFFGALQATVYLLVYKGFGKGQLAVLNPIFASFSGLAAILSVVVFGEVVSGHLVLSLITIFVGVLLLNIDGPALFSRRINFLRTPGFPEIATATVLAAFWTVLWNQFTGGQDWLSYALFMYLFMTIVMLLVAKFQGIRLSFSKPHVWKFLVLIGFCEAVAYGAITLGYSATTETSIIALLSGAFSLPVIILARIFLKEKVHMLQTAGAVVIIGGIILLALV